MSKKQELRELKAKAQTLEARLHALNRRIGAFEHQGPQPSALKAVVDPEKCVACGLCEETCPVGAMTVGETARVDPMRCIGCGRCAEQCPQEAISMEAPGYGPRRQGVGKGAYRS
jgi:ferredoxin